MKLVVHPLSNLLPPSTSGSQLRPGYPATPRRVSLPLLPSGPGGVRSLLPRRTRSSSPLTLGGRGQINPRGGVRPR